MTLCVDVFVVGPDGERTVLDVPPGHSDLAGFERWRTLVWGAPEVRDLGARFFPVLAERDLEVEPDEVPAFLAECALLRANLAVLGPDPYDQVAFRLGNIEQAARRALEVCGGVLVW